MKLKNGQLNLKAIEELKNLSSLNLPIKISFKLSKIIKEISSLTKIINEEEKKILDKYGEKDKNGEFVKVLDKDGNINPNTIKIKKNEVENCNKDMNELREIENEIDIEKIKIEDLGEDLKISPNTFLLLDWLFEG
ncbi:MAG: hypothetical protein KAX49_13710 [Halanaerobiales bacterium]|nr:hypothetical protein [Halanaerobiales bacterium]